MMGITADEISLRQTEANETRNTMLLKTAGGIFRSSEAPVTQQVPQPHRVKEERQSMSLCSQIKAAVSEIMNEVKPSLTLQVDFTAGAAERPEVTDDTASVCFGGSLDGSEVYVFSSAGGGDLANVSALNRGGKIAL